MRNTIKAKVGYTIKKFWKKSTFGSHTSLFGKVYDGDEYLMTAEYKTMEEYEEEKRDNECFIKHEVFTTEKGNQFIYWGDTEFGFDYITKVNAEG